MPRNPGDPVEREAFAAFVQALLTATGWAQRELAERATLSQTTISDVKAAKKGDDETQSKLAKAGGFTVEQVLAGEAVRALESGRVPVRVVTPDVLPREALAADSANFDAFMRGRLLAAKDERERAEAEVALDHAARELKDQAHHGAAFDLRTLKHAYAVGLAFVRGEEPPPHPPATVAKDQPLQKPRTLAESIAADAAKKKRRS